jgi:hypothetical protein
VGVGLQEEPMLRANLETNENKNLKPLVVL